MTKRNYTRNCVVIPRDHNRSQDFQPSQQVLKVYTNLLVIVCFNPFIEHT